MLQRNTQAAFRKRLADNASLAFLSIPPLLSWPAGSLAMDRQTASHKEADDGLVGGPVAGIRSAQPTASK